MLVSTAATLLTRTWVVAATGGVVGTVVVVRATVVVGAVVVATRVVAATRVVGVVVVGTSLPSSLSLSFLVSWAGVVVGAAAAGVEGARVAKNRKGEN